VILRAHGDAGQLETEPIDVGEPGSGELRVRQTAVGVNFHDVYVRTGAYRTLPLPGIPGIEAVGVVEAVGSDVKQWSPGDRLGYVSRAYGGYASHRLLDARLAIRLPDDVEEVTAAAMLVRGLTVQMLAEIVHPVTRGETVLVHAAAGGVGRLLVQWLAAKGAFVIGTVGSAAKAAMAHAAGCRHVIRYREEDFVARVRDITVGRGLDLAYDSVGRDTFDGSLDLIRPRGHLVLFGQSSGVVAPVDVSRLAAKSLALSRPILFDYLDDPVCAHRMVDGLLDALAKGRLSPPPIREFRLESAGEAHRLLEAGASREGLVLIP
jgi:NADPH2:quinone reductase